MTTSDRPSFPSLDAFKAYAAAGLSDFPGASSIRYDVTLAGVCMTLDAHRDGRVTLVRAW